MDDVIIGRCGSTGMVVDLSRLISCNHRSERDLK